MAAILKNHESIKFGLDLFLLLLTHDL